MNTLKFTAALVLLLVTNCVIAAIGTITDQTQQPASITRKAATVSGVKGTGVEMDDAVRTTQGKVGITFQDDTRVVVNENSKLVIDTFVYDPNNKKGGKLAMNVALGTVRYASGAVAHNNPDNVKLTTPTATIAVRGTDFTMTVDELGRSTIILLPSCPVGWHTIRDCVVGKIEVTTEEGTVMMNQAYQATVTVTRETRPLPPVILALTEEQISNLLILSPPRELKKDEKGDRASTIKSALDVDFLKENGLANAFDLQDKEKYANKLDRNPLDNANLPNILDMINQQMMAYLNLLNNSSSKLLPDYKPSTGIVAEVDDLSVTLIRQSDGNIQSITVPKDKQLTIFQEDGATSIKNRVNDAGNTTITVRQQ